MKTRLNPFLRFSSILAAATALATSAQAVDYTWGGGTSNWGDTSATGWNGGPPATGDTATIIGGTVSLSDVTDANNASAATSITIGSGGQFNVSNSLYRGYGNLILQGGTLNGSGSYNAYGASYLGNVTVSGTAASTITGTTWFNVGNNTYTVADVTGDSATDLLVSTSLRGSPSSPDDWNYTAASITKEGAGTMEFTVHSYFWGGLTLNGGTLKVSGGDGGYGFFSGAVNVNSGTTLTINSDGTGFGYQNGWKPSSVNINGGTVNGGGNHVWGISGGVNMTGGTFESASFQWNFTNLNTNASADTATVAGPINLRGDGGYSSMAVNVADGAADTDLLISGNITEENGSVGITKSGAGTMVLSGSRTSYTGATVVSEGTLFVTGALGNTAVSVATNATVGGSGSIAGTLSFGVDSFFDVFSAVVGNDPLAVTGTVTFGSGFGINNLTGIDWNSVSLGTYTLIDSTQDFSLAGLDNWGSGNAVSVAAGKSAYFTNGSLQLVVIPEPGAALLGSLGMLMLLRRRRS